MHDVIVSKWFILKQDVASGKHIHTTIGIANLTPLPSTIEFLARINVR